MDFTIQYIRRMIFKKVPSKRNSIVNNIKLNYTLRFRFFNIMDDITDKYQEDFALEFTKLVEQFKTTITAAELYYNNIKGMNVIDDSDYTKEKMQLAQKLVEQIVLMAQNLYNIAVLERAISDD